MRNSLLGTLILAAAPGSAAADTPKHENKAPASLEVTSSAFENNGMIPREYTCDGSDQTPQLSWSKVPAATKSIAVLVEDPDAPRGTFTHWLVTGIPPTATSLGGAMPAGAIAAKNDMGAAGYKGPCPPSGRHHYVFRVFALDIDRPKATNRSAFLKSVNGHVLASGQLVGTYERAQR